MISRSELNPHKYPETPEIKRNLDTLLLSINHVRAEWGKPMIVTSGLRGMNDHIRIYKDKAKKAGKPFNIKDVPMKSKHLVGAAVDIKDSNGSLARWCKRNEKVLIEAGLWCEDPQYTGGWVHFQCLPPKSNKRFFIP